MIKMIEVGEETNSLDDVLMRSCAFLDLETENSLSSLSSALGPVMLVIMGAVIGVMFLAVYAPILSVINAF
ncbi:MAG: type II secretion system F family protein [Clostridia bacterium]|nr:type II secretion system F family protein [Clostridia bacterium]